MRRPVRPLTRQTSRDLVDEYERAMRQRREAAIDTVRKAGAAKKAEKLAQEKDLEWPEK